MASNLKISKTNILALQNLLDDGQKMVDKMWGSGFGNQAEIAKEYQAYGKWNARIEPFQKKDLVSLPIYSRGLSLTPPRSAIGRTIQTPEVILAFKEFKRQFVEAAEWQIEKIAEIVAHISSAENRKVTVVLDDTGMIWRDPKEKNFHIMNVREKRYKMLRRLFEMGGYVKTKSLISTPETDKKRRTLSKEKRAINALMRKKLNLPKNLIDSQRGPGFRINPVFTARLDSERS